MNPVKSYRNGTIDTRGNATPVVTYMIRRTQSRMEWRFSPMGYKAKHLAAMEERGYMDTSESLVNRVAQHLAKSPNDKIDTDEFRRACIACNVDPDSFTQEDLEKLQRKLR